MNNDDAKNVILSEIDAILKGSVRIRDECAACHIIYTIAEKMSLSESDAADLLSQMLTNDSVLSDRFIDAIESAHMRTRGKALAFYNRDREAKDRYVASYIRNALAELQSDATIHGSSIALRRIILNYLSGYLAQTLGIDFHASTEELYYVLRKHDELEANLSDFIAWLAKSKKNGG